MGNIESRLKELGIELPAPLELPSKNRTGAVRAGNLLFVSGHGADLLEDEQVKKRGKVGLEVSEKEAYQTARACAIKMLATIKLHIGDLDNVKQVVKIHGLINAHDDFERHNMVLNGASDLFYEVFGPDKGCHARSSVGVSGLVARQPVEIEGIIEIEVD